MSFFNFNKYLAYILIAIVILIHISLIIANICSIQYPDTYQISNTVNVTCWVLSLIVVLLVFGWQYSEQKKIGEGPIGLEPSNSIVHHPQNNKSNNTNDNNTIPNIRHLKGSSGNSYARFETDD